jgi:hypothetical protein
MRTQDITRRDGILVSRKAWGGHRVKASRPGGESSSGPGRARSRRSRILDGKNASLAVVKNETASREAAICHPNYLEARRVAKARPGSKSACIDWPGDPVQSAKNSTQDWATCARGVQPLGAKHWDLVARLIAR